ncbi:cytochrome P450 3A11 [Trichonephila clavipes]|nr:cytochrome P450 3A11 [Trichonephila clavipes]
MGIKYLEPIFWYGTYKDNLEKPLHEVENERYKKFKESSIYGYFQGATPVISVCNIEKVPRIAACPLKPVLSTGNKVVDSMFTFFSKDRWTRARGTVRKAFDKQSLKNMFDEITDKSNKLVERIKTNTEKGEPINVKKVFGTFTMEVIVKACFDTDIDAINNPTNKYMEYGSRIFDRGSELGEKLVFLSHYPSITKWLGFLSDNEAMMFFRNEAIQIIEKRWHSGSVKDDLLRKLLDTRFDNEEVPNGEISNGSIDQSTNSKKLGMFTLEEITSQCVLFFLGGYHTVSTALTMACYLLATNEEVQNTLRDKIDEVIIRDNGKFTFDALDDIEYLKFVIYETLRLYPSTTKIERVADENYSVEGTDVVIPKGTYLSIPLCSIHRDPDNYEEAEKFDPSRFLRDPPTKNKYLPFGIGPRKCIGENFGMMEMKICLVYIIGNFKTEVCPQTKIPPEFGLALQGFLQIEEMMLRLTPRENPPFTQAYYTRLMSQIKETNGSIATLIPKKI